MFEGLVYSTRGSCDCNTHDLVVSSVIPGCRKVIQKEKKKG